MFSFNSCTAASLQSTSLAAGIGASNTGRIYHLCAEDWTSPRASQLAKENILAGGVPTSDASLYPILGCTNSLSATMGGAMAELLGDDISRVMCNRALVGYGMQAKENIGLNSELLGCHGSVNSINSLTSVWQWLGRARAMTVSNSYRVKPNQPYCYHGLLSVISQSSNRSDTLNKPWTGLETGKQLTTRVFRSEARSLCLQLVTWLPVSPTSNGHSTLNGLDAVIEASVQRCHITRAAALAVFQLNLPSAISILQSAAQNFPTFNAVAMALAGLELM